MDLGIELRRKCCWISKILVILYFDVSAICWEQFRSKGGGKTTIHYNGSTENIGLLLQKIISVNQLSFCGAVAGMIALGTPFGHMEFVKAQLRVKAEEHEVLLNRVKAVSNLQCALLILFYCCVARACGGVRKDTTMPSGRCSTVWWTSVQTKTLSTSSLPCRLGGVGLRNAVSGVQAAFWSSWADSLHMIWKRKISSQCRWPEHDFCDFRDFYSSKKNYQLVEELQGNPLHQSVGKKQKILPQLLLAGKPIAKTWGRDC